MRLLYIVDCLLYIDDLKIYCTEPLKVKLNTILKTTKDAMKVIGLEIMELEEIFSN